MQSTALRLHASRLRLSVSRADAQEWADTETTTALWRAISSGDKEALETLLEADEKNAHVRAADGRGPLWCVPAVR